MNELFSIFKPSFSIFKNQFFNFDLYNLSLVSLTIKHDKTAVIDSKVVLFSRYKSYFC